jgi:hypothetical protein
MYYFLRKYKTKSNLKRVFALLIFIITIAPASIFASNPSEETIAVFKTAIEALNIIEHPFSGRGTAITKLYARHSNLRSGEKIFDFEFKGDMSRSTRFGVEEGKRGQPEVVWIKGEKCSVTLNHSKKYASVESNPQYQFYHQLGYDFNPDTFMLWYLTPVSEHIRRVLNGPANLSTKIDSDGILHLITDYKDQNQHEHQVIYLDPAKDYRLVGGLNIREDLKDPNRNHTDFLEIQWGQYGSNWYIKNAQFSVYKGVHSPEEKDSIDPDKLIKNTSVTITGFHPNVKVDDSEFTLDGLGLSNGTLVVNKISGLKYMYNPSEKIESDKAQNLNSDDNKLTKKVSAEYILDKIIEHRNKVENFKCIHEKRIYNTEKGRQMFYKDYLKMGLPEEHALEALNEVYSYEIDNLALDNKSCGRVETVTKEIDKKGNLTGKIKSKSIDTWDGNKAVKYREQSEKAFASIGGAEPPLPLTKKYLQPWRTFGGNFCDSLKSALEKNNKVKVEKQKDGKYRIEFSRSEESRIIGLIDPNQGYSTISREAYKQERLIGTYSAQFEQVKPGVWFPVSGEYILGSTADPLATMTMSIKEIKINDPNFYDGLYHVDFKEGTRVTDKISGLRYVFSEQTNPPGN